VGKDIRACTHKSAGNARYGGLNGRDADIVPRPTLTQLRHFANDYLITLSARAPLRMLFKELRRHDPARP